MLESHFNHLSDIEFLTYVALRRLPFDYETWRNGNTLAAKIAIRTLLEFQNLNAPDRRLLHRRTSF